MGGWDQNGSYGDSLGVWSGCSWLRIGNEAGTYEYGDEPAGTGATELVKILTSLLDADLRAVLLSTQLVA
jgi:hypothetical protein